MAVEWTERLAVGNDLIDSQHRELIRRFDSLLDACQERRGREEIIDLLRFLDSYVAVHFTAEEGLMDVNGYPGIEEHQEQHRTFVRRLANLQESLENRGASVDLVLQTNRTLLDWFIVHIKSADVKFGAFLKAAVTRGAMAR